MKHALPKPHHTTATCSHHNYIRIIQPALHTFTTPPPPHMASMRSKIKSKKSKARNQKQKTKKKKQRKRKKKLNFRPGFGVLFLHFH